MIAPLFETLSNDYAGKVIFLKVDVDAVAVSRIAYLTDVTIIARYLREHVRYRPG